jgi:histidine triad (HIT) family protein
MSNPAPHSPDFHDPAPHDPACLFCRIVAGQIPAHRVYEDDLTLAFLDLHPIRPGHVLVIPRAHHVWFEDMPPRDAAAVMATSQRISRALKEIHGVERVALFFTGIHVPHAHAHLVPMRHVHDVTSAAYLGDGLEGYSIPPRLPEDEMAGIAGALRDRLG